MNGPKSQPTHKMPEPQTNSTAIAGSSRTTCSALGVGYKILIQTSLHNPPQTWRILGIQNGIALISEGWGVRKLVPMNVILSDRFFVLESKAPWWLRFFIQTNVQVLAPAGEKTITKPQDV